MVPTEIKLIPIIVSEYYKPIDTDRKHITILMWELYWNQVLQVEIIPIPIISKPIATSGYYIYMNIFKWHQYILADSQSDTKKLALIRTNRKWIMTSSTILQQYNF